MVRYIDPNILLRIMRQIKKKPLKVWIARDFGNSNKRRYLELLVSLRILERCDVQYNRPGAIYWSGKTAVKGYILRREFR